MNGMGHLLIFGMILSLCLCDPHPFSVYDMVGLDRLGLPEVNPSGTQALFTRWTYDLISSQSAQSIWVVDLQGNNSFAVTSAGLGQSDYNPVWIDDSSFVFLSASRSSSGSSQVFFSSVGSANAPTQVTDYPVDVETLRVFTLRGIKYIGFTSRVYSQSTMAQTREIDDAKAKDPSSGLTFNRLYFRHWDTFSDQKYSHLFISSLTKLEDGSYQAEATPTDLLFGLDLETPVAPFGGNTDYFFSPDGTQATFAALKPGLDQAWSTDTNIYIVNTTGTISAKSITDFNTAQDSLPAYSPDGRKIAYLAMRVPKYEADRRRVVIYDRTTGVHTTLTEAWDRSPSSLAWSTDSASIYLTVPDEARENIYIIDVASQRITFLVRGGFHSGLSATPRGLVFARNSQLAPNEIFTYSAGSLVQRTFVNQEKLQNILTSTPEEFWFTGSLGDRVHGWIIKPVGFDSTVKYPVAFLVHGGPQSAWQDSFSTRWNPQAFAGAGFVVVTVDPHGSTTYGQAFTDAINGEWGSYPFEDLMLGLDYALSTYSFLDGKRVAALGASYGGFMMNWFNGNTDRFVCLVNHDGLSDTTAMYYTTEELFFPEYDFRGTPWESRDIYEKWNPINLVTNWKTPTLIIHGGKDYRVVDGQGFAAFTALQRQGVPSRLLYFPDENHWVLKPANSIRWYSEVLSWIETYTRPQQNN